MRKIGFLLMCLLPLSLLAQPFKHKLYDPQVNVNDLIAEAEAWFAVNGTGPGKGWKGYQRWRWAMEPRFFPSGDRSLWDPGMIVREYATFKAAAGTQRAGGGGYWTFRGPANADDILPPNWAAGLGRVEAVWAGAATPDTVYIGSRSGGFWKTYDGGANWRSTNQDLPAMGVVDIEVDPAQHNVVYVLTRHAAGYTYGLLKSTDHGETWASTGLSYGAQQAYPAKFFLATSDTLFVATNGGILRSGDAGATWTQVYNGNMVTIVGHPTQSQTLYAFDSNSMSTLRRSTNGGTTWTNHAIPGNSGYPFLAVSPASPDFLFLGSGSGIFRSTDRGATWSLRSADPTNSGVMTMGVSATNADIVFAGSLNHYVSTDGGATWSVFADWVNYFGTNYIHADMRAFRAWGNRIYACTDGFLGYSSDNGSTWTKINQGTGLREFYRIGCSAMDAETVVGGSQDNGTSVMLHGDWKEWIGADGMQAHVDLNNPDIWFGTIQNGSLQRTTQAGQNAAGVAPTGNGAWITPSVLDPSNDNTLFIGYDSVYKSNDNGSTWRVLNGFTGGNLDEIAIAPSDSNVLYVSRNATLRRSTDNGNTWAIVSSGLPILSITRIAVHPQDPMHVAVSFSGFSGGNKVFASTNGGSNWTNLSGTLPNIPANALAWAEGTPARLFLGMDVGVYYADAGSNAWTLYADSLPAVVINDLEVLEGAGLLRAGTWGRGLWEAPLPGREGGPQVVEVLLSPRAAGPRPKPADSVRVTARIVGPLPIAAATLRWGTSPGAQPNSAAMAGVGADSFRAVLPPMPEHTRVYFRITGVATNGDSARTERLMYQVQPGIPCAATGSQGTTFDFIDTVRVRTLSHASGQDYYGDFRNLYTDLYRDSSYTLMASLNYSFTSDSMFLWLDWNDDGDFQASEQVVMSDLDADHKSYGSFTVPHVPVVPDTVVMRVRCIYGNNVVADPCNSYFGEVEDYSVVLRDSGSVVGVHEGIGMQLRLVPNPAQDVVTVQWSPAVPEGVTIRVRDLQGREVMAPVSVAGAAATLSLKGLASGLYVVELEDRAFKLLRVDAGR